MTADSELFPYVEVDPTRGSLSRFPYLPLSLQLVHEITDSGPLDTGSSINVLPFDVGLRLGAAWERETTTVTLTGNLRDVEAKALVTMAKVAGFPPVRLAFAWTKSNDVPVLLGQVNFFMEFDVCFFRAESAFEVRPRKSGK
ncbi:MAG TPA: hypothetical protein VGH33_00710 [Isosphaeraceae bacterium]